MDTLAATTDANLLNGAENVSVTGQSLWSLNWVTCSNFGGPDLLVFVSFGILNVSLATVEWMNLTSRAARSDALAALDRASRIISFNVRSFRLSARLLPFFSAYT